ncbi:uncharacterized protein LOC134542690 [Bacillus rossius redtenbacheri]|uniref:uncharacterized protein LOC134542690 n=1 Tax=Bacillus rossius redtenbacheri TaxID=93214 RepID=UPI002FDEB8CC
MSKDDIRLCPKRTSIVSSTAVMYGSNYLNRSEFDTLGDKEWSDAAIDACLALVLSDAKSDVVYFPSNLFKQLSDYPESRQDQSNFLNTVQLCGKQLVFIPVHVSGNHWTLIVANFVQKGFLYLNYFGYKKNLGQLLFMEFINIMCEHQIHTDDFIDLDGWKFLNPPDHPIENDYNCGIFIIFFMKRLAENMCLTVKFDVNAFRKTLKEKISELSKTTGKIEEWNEISNCGYLHEKAMSNGLFLNSCYFSVEEEIVLSCFEIGSFITKLRCNHYSTYMADSLLSQNAVDAGIAVFLRLLRQLNGVIYERICFMPIYVGYLCLERPNNWNREWYEDVFGNLHTKEWPIMPYIKHNNHWSLLIANIQKKVVHHLDSLGELTNKLCTNKFLKFLKVRNKMTKNEIEVSHWKDENMRTQIPLQSDGVSCGLFVVFYVACFSETFAPKVERAWLQQSVLKHSDSMVNICLQCGNKENRKSDMEKWVMCHNMCGRWAHFRPCLRHINERWEVINSNDYSFICALCQLNSPVTHQRQLTFETY